MTVRSGHGEEGRGEVVRRLLLVEPNRSVLTVLTRRLSAAGYRLSAADAGTAAITEMHRQRPDAVLAEWNGGSGGELIGMIRDDISLHDTPVLLIAGRSDRPGMVAALASGADDVLAKPFDFDLLVARIARQIDRAGAVRRLRDDNAALDARVVTRALEIGELKAELAASERERRRLMDQAHDA